MKNFSDRLFTEISPNVVSEPRQVFSWQMLKMLPSPACKLLWLRSLGRSESRCHHKAGDIQTPSNQVIVWRNKEINQTKQTTPPLLLFVESNNWLISLDKDINQLLDWLQTNNIWSFLCSSFLCWSFKKQNALRARVLNQSLTEDISLLSAELGIFVSKIYKTLNKISCNKTAIFNSELFSNMCL